MNEAKSKKRAEVPQDTSKPLINCAFDELVPLEKLVPNPGNPNQHPQSQVALLAKVIGYQGWRSPIVVSKRSGFIVSGHGRYEAARTLGLSKVPVDYQDFPTDADEWAHLVADNRLAELAEADNAALREILGELQANDFDLDVVGFDADALAGLLADPPEPTPPEDFKSVDEDLPTEYQCPKCSYRWSGKPS